MDPLPNELHSKGSFCDGVIEDENVKFLVQKLQGKLLKNNSQSKGNLYDHLVQLLMKVLEEKPQNALDNFEELSYDVKQSLVRQRKIIPRDIAQPTAAEVLAEQQRLLFLHSDEADQEDKLEETALPNINQLTFYLEQAGASLGREEMQMIFLALKQLVISKGLRRCHLWGKILGIKSNYIIAEADYEEGEEDEEQNAEDAFEKKDKDDTTKKNKDLKPPFVVPKEPIGTGANKYVYYVCSKPGLPWIKLPSLTPTQISSARQIRKFFTGQLDTPIVSTPPFPGNESNYLRAQIARISAGTHVSPQGYYYMNDEENEQMEVNPDFEGIPAAVMSESLSSWVHHVEHILIQGRCTWVNPDAKAGNDSSEEEESDESEEEADECEEESGPSLLTSLTEDLESNSISPWIIKLSSLLTPQHAVAVLRSNLWPGAFAYACGKKFNNIYVGWGLKYNKESHTAPPPPSPHGKCPSSPEISGAEDLPVEEELAQKEALESDQEESDEVDD